MTDDGLVVASGNDVQWLWRPLVDGDVIDMVETAPGRVVIGSTGAGLVVNDGDYGHTSLKGKSPIDLVPNVPGQNT